MGFQKMNNHTCKYYNGDWHNTHCRAGVSYKDVTTGTKAEPGSAFRKPCVNWELFDKQKVDPSTRMTESQRKEWNRRGTCAKFELPTKQEIADEEAAWESHFKKVEIVTRVVAPLRKLNTGNGYQGIHECPVCKNKLHISISGYNGHARVYCETADCVRWFE